MILRTFFACWKFLSLSLLPKPARPFTVQKNMGLTYRFTFTAPATTTAAELEKFLKSVESDAQAMGFKPTQLFQATFDTKERRDFARQIRTMYRLTDDRLNGVVIPAENQVWRHNSHFGDCWILPEQAVVLVVTDERQMETVFAFARYTETLNDFNGRPLLKIPVGGRWYFSDFVQTPDPRFRKIVSRFADAGFLESATDDFAPK
jgi:hypothetical protein